MNEMKVWILNEQESMNVLKHCALTVSRLTCKLLLPLSARIDYVHCMIWKHSVVMLHKL